MSEVIKGPLWAARNWSADAGAGSIHDDVDRSGAWDSAAGLSQGTCI